MELQTYSTGHTNIGALLFWSSEPESEIELSSLERSNAIRVSFGAVQRRALDLSSVGYASRSLIDRKLILISDLADPNIELIRPLPISLEHFKGGCLAYSYDIEELITGTDEFAVVNDMRRAIVELYAFLHDEEENLGPLQQRHYDFLKRIIRRKN